MSLPSAFAQICQLSICLKRKLIIERNVCSMTNPFPRNGHFSAATALDTSEGPQREHRATSRANQNAEPVGNASSLQALPSGPPVQLKTRPKHSKEFKERILDQADNCQDGDQVNALLRRGGLCSPQLLLWREQRKRDTPTTLTRRKRDRQLNMHSRLIRENERLKLQNQRLSKRLGEAEVISEFQKRLAEALEILLKNRE